RVSTAYNRWPTITGSAVPRRAGFVRPAGCSVGKLSALVAFCRMPGTAGPSRPATGVRRTHHPAGQSPPPTTAAGRPDRRTQPPSRAVSNRGPTATVQSRPTKRQEHRSSPLRAGQPYEIIKRMYDIIKADLRFGLYRYAETEMERQVAGLVDEQYEDDLMCRLTRSRRIIGCVEALRVQALAEFAAARPSKKYGERFSEWAADEIAVAMRWTRNMAFAQLHLAVTVTSRLPGTLAALSRGEVDLRGVQALAEITNPLDDATAKAVEDAVLPKAADKNVSELRRAARRAVLRLDPAGAQQRHEKRKRERRVELTPLEDAMAELTAYLPAPDATAIYQRLNDFAHNPPPDDTRTMDQRRADVFCDLLLGTPITTPDNTTTPNT